MQQQGRGLGRLAGMSGWDGALVRKEQDKEKEKEANHLRQKYEAAMV
ncbi:MAG TPA: hypothetical protein VHF07_03995 [Nitrospiraceae bacterium]|nr:hypothetical protein [Nitrospiraceae bacterium]